MARAARARARQRRALRRRWEPNLEMLLRIDDPAAWACEDERREAYESLIEQGALPTDTDAFWQFEVGIPADLRHQVEPPDPRDAHGPDHDRFEAMDLAHRTHQRRRAAWLTDHYHDRSDSDDG